METPILTSNIRGIVNSFSDPQNVIDARSFAFGAMSAGNKGCNVYFRALSIFYWNLGNKEESAKFARLSN